MNETSPKSRREMSRPSIARREPSDREVALYTADMMLELRQMAKAAGLGTLQALIELVYYEAFATANPVAISPAERERLRNLEAHAGRVAGTG